MGTILVNKYFKYLSLHPYWKKLNEEQKYIVFNKALRELKPITKLEVGDIAKTYYEHDVYKSDFSKVKENINLDEDNLNFILGIVRTKIKTAKYTTFTRDKVPEQYFKKNLSILINYIIPALVKEIKSFAIFNTVRTLNVTVKEIIYKPFDILTNIVRQYRIFDFLSREFSLDITAIKKTITFTCKYPFTNIIKFMSPLSFIENFGKEVNYHIGSTKSNLTENFRKRINYYIDSAKSNFIENFSKEINYHIDSAKLNFADFAENFSKEINYYVSSVQFLSILGIHSGEFNIEVRSSSNIEQEIHNGYKPNLTISHLFIGV